MEGGEASRKRGSSDILYIHGYGKRNELWFRVVMTKEDGKRGDRQTIEPVAKLCRRTYGIAGSWTVVGDEDIYWIGGYSYGDDRAYVHSKLHKHNIIRHSFDSSLWEPASSPMDIPRSKPFLTAVGRKLYAVAGTEHYAWDDKHESPIWKNCGQVYDLHEKTWQYLKPHINNFDCYDPRRAALVVKEDGEEPTEIVYYSLDVGSVLFIDFTSGELRPILGLDSLDLWRRRTWKPPPKGLKGCEADASALNNVTTHVPAVFSNNTFYWFTPSLRLYGYDIVRQRWLHSASLQDKLPTLESVVSARYPPCPVLFGPQNGNFFVIVAEIDRGQFTMVSLTVTREKNSLIVSLESVRAFRVGGGESFVPVDGMAMAMLRNTMSGLGKKRRIPGRLPCKDKSNLL